MKLAPKSQQVATISNVPVESVQIPPFARTTASKRIKDSIADSEQTLTLDIQKTQQRNQQLIEEHLGKLREERAQDPGRFSIQKQKSTGSSGSNSSKSLKRSDSLETKSKELNLSKKAQEWEQSEQQSKNILSKPILFDLNNLAAQSLRDTQIYPQKDMQKDAITTFIESIQSLSEQVVEKVFSMIEEKMAVYVRTMLHNPREFWTFASIFIGGLGGDVNSFSFRGRRERVSFA